MFDSYLGLSHVYDIQLIALHTEYCQTPEVTEVTEVTSNKGRNNF